MIRLALLALIPGLPLALLFYPRRTVSLPRLGVEAVSLGVLWYLLVGLAATRVHMFSARTILGVAVGFAVVVALWAAPNVARIEVRRPSPTAWLLLALLLLGFYLRRDAIYFIYEIDDMGEYVNRANRLVHEGELMQSFPHGFTVALGLSRLGLGPREIVAVVSLLGSLFLALVPAVSWALGRGPWTTVLVTAITAVHVVPVWFSRLPASEALYAPLLLAGVYWFITSLRDHGSPARAVAGGCFLGALLFVRGNAILLLPLLALYLCAMALSLDRRGARICAWFVGTASAGLVAGYAYNLAFVRPYFVHLQLAQHAGPTVTEFLGRVGWLDLSWSLGAASLAGLGLLLVTASVMAGRVAPRGPARLVFLGLAATLALLLALPLGGLAEASRHHGWLLLGLAACGVITGARTVGSRRGSATLGLALLLVVVFGGLFAWRFDRPLDHPVFLYYDRYLFSEVFPGLLLLAMCGAHRLEILAGRLRRRPVARYAAIPLLGGIAVAGLVDLVRPTMAATREIMFAGAYEQIETLDRMTRTKGTAPIIFSGFAERPVEWIFPNTYRAFVVPLSRSFGRELLNEPAPPFAPDPVLSPTRIGTLMRERDARGAYLIVAADSGLAGGLSANLGRPLRSQLIGDTRMSVPILRRQIGRRTSPFGRVDVDLRVYWLELAAGVELATPPPPRGRSDGPRRPGADRPRRRRRRPSNLTGPAKRENGGPPLAAPGRETVSIVVPAHGRPGELAECLAALRQSAGGEAEIIVVDDASPNDLREVGEQGGALVLRLSENAGPAAARNHGARHARGSILVFVDADVLVRPDTIPRVVRTLEAEPGVAAVFGSYDARPRDRGLISQYRNLFHHFTHQTANGDAFTFWAGCGAIRRAVFEAVGGFDDRRFRQPSIEDIELGYRLRRAGHRVVLDRELQGTHLKRWTVALGVRTDIFRRAVPWARLILETGEAPNDLNLRRGQRVSVTLVALASVCLALAAFRTEALLVAVAALATVVAVNWRLFAFFRRERGLAFAAACVPLQFLYYLCGGMSYLYVWGALGGRRLGRRLIGRTSSPRR